MKTKVFCLLITYELGDLLLKTSPFNTWNLISENHNDKLTQDSLIWVTAHVQRGAREDSLKCHFF